jgi:hypothetical protein
LSSRFFPIRGNPKIEFFILISFQIQNFNNLFAICITPYFSKKKYNTSLATKPTKIDTQRFPCNPHAQCLQKNVLRVFQGPRLAGAVFIQAQQVALKLRAVNRLDQRNPPFFTFASLILATAVNNRPFS